jgi:hypothetical protein
VSRRSVDDDGDDLEISGGSKRSANRSSKRWTVRAIVVRLPVVERHLFGSDFVGDRRLKPDFSRLGTTEKRGVAAWIPDPLVGRVWAGPTRTAFPATPPSGGVNTTVGPSGDQCASRPRTSARRRVPSSREVQTQPHRLAGRSHRLGQSYLSSACDA